MDFTYTNSQRVSKRKSRKFSLVFLLLRMSASFIQIVMSRTLKTLTTLRPSNFISVLELYNNLWGLRSE
jgi:hypothetical protein